MNDCIAVGTNNSNTAAGAPLAEFWNGTKRAGNNPRPARQKKHQRGVLCGT